MYNPTAFSNARATSRPSSNASQVSRLLSTIPSMGSSSPIRTPTSQDAYTPRLFNSESLYASFLGRDSRLVDELMSTKKPHMMSLVSQDISKIYLSTSRQWQGHGDPISMVENAVMSDCQQDLDHIITISKAVTPSSRRLLVALALEKCIVFQRMDMTRHIFEKHMAHANTIPGSLLRDNISSSMLNLLLSLNLHPNAKLVGEDGRTSVKLIRWVLSDHDSVQALLNRGAHAYLGNSPADISEGNLLDHAVTEASVGTIRLLIQSGAHFSSRSFHIAIRMAARLGIHPSCNYKTYIHDDCFSSDEAQRLASVLRYLVQDHFCYSQINSYAHVDGPNRMTPLEIAMSQDKGYQVYCWLLEHGAHPAYADANGFRAMAKRLNRMTWLSELGSPSASYDNNIKPAPTSHCNHHTGRLMPGAVSGKPTASVVKTKTKRGKRGSGINSRSQSTLPAASPNLPSRPPVSFAKIENDDGKVTMLRLLKRGDQKSQNIMDGVVTLKEQREIGPEEKSRDIEAIEASFKSLLSNRKPVDPEENSWSGKGRRIIRPSSAPVLGEGNDEETA